MNCETKWVIYLIDDIVCKRSYVGSSEINTRTRWTNHKSHIRNNLATCEIAKHFKEDHTNHPFERKSKLNLFDDNLKNHLNVTIIDYLSSEYSTQKLKEREAYWQNQLRTYTNYGGFNKRDPRTETTNQSYLSHS